MRISDWSSDVCSSDLLGLGLVVLSAGASGDSTDTSCPKLCTWVIGRCSLQIMCFDELAMHAPVVQRIFTALAMPTTLKFGIDASKHQQLRAATSQFMFTR